MKTYDLTPSPYAKGLEILTNTVIRQNQEIEKLAKMFLEVIDRLDDVDKTLLVIEGRK